MKFKETRSFRKRRSKPVSKEVVLSYFYSSYGTSFVLTELVKSIPKDWLSYAKFRISYAKVGNDTGFDQLLNGFTYNNSYLGDMAWFESENKRKTNALKPESTTSFETGFDLRFLKDRVSLNFTYYNKNKNKNDYRKVGQMTSHCGLSRLHR